jgi:hypothetical protein
MNNSNFNQNGNQNFNQQGYAPQQNQGYPPQQGYPQNNQYMNQDPNQGYNPQGQVPQQQYQQQMPPQQQYQQQAPQQQMPQGNVTGFTAAEAGVQPAFNNNNENYERNPDVYNVPDGQNIGRIYKVVDLGSHPGYQNQGLLRKLRISFEFPQYCQRFNLKSEEFKPSAVHYDVAFFTSSKSKLRKLINASVGRTLSDDEAKVFNYAELLGKMLLLTIQNKVSSQGNVFSNVIDFAQANPNVVVIPPAFTDPNTPRNNYTCFAIGPNCSNLLNESFANLTLKDRKDIIKSTEAEAFLANGGIVFRNKNNEKDNFYNKELAVTSSQYNNQNFQPQGNFPQQQVPQQQYQQQMPQQQYQPQAPQGQQPNYGAFGQSAQQAMQEQYQQQAPQQQYQPQGNFPQEIPQQNNPAMQAPQGMQPNVNPAMQQAAQVYDNQQQQYQQEPPLSQQPGSGFSMGNGEDDLPF